MENESVIQRLQKLTVPSSRFSLWDWVPSVLLAFGIFAVILIRSGASLFRPLQGGDLFAAYALAGRHGLCEVGSGPQFGFPIGQSPLYFPSSDWAITFPANLISCLSGNQFFGLNAMWALSFPLVALVAAWSFSQLYINRTLTTLLSLSIVFMPFHWQRIGHIYLATMYSLVLGCGLVLWLANRSVLRNELKEYRGLVTKRTKLWLLAICALIAGGGVYYAVFTLILMIALILYAFASGHSRKTLLVLFQPVVAVLGFLFLAYIPALLFSREFPNTENPATRSALDSFIYSMNLDRVMLLSPTSGLPLPIGIRDKLFEFDALNYTYNLPTFGESGGYANVIIFFAWFTAMFSVVYLLRTRNRARNGQHSKMLDRMQKQILTVGYILLSLILFSVPWGLNVLFAWLVTPQIRAWGRLEPALAFYILGIFGLTLTFWLRNYFKAILIGSMALSLLLVVDVYRPFKNTLKGSFASTNSSIAEAIKYSNAANEAIPAKCGVLQIPFVTYPEGPALFNLGKEAHFEVSLMNPEKNWSYGEYNGDPRGGVAKSVGNEISESEVAILLENGFCAIHLDARGIDPVSVEGVKLALNNQFGNPKATGLDGNWSFWALSDK